MLDAISFPMLHLSAKWCPFLASFRLFSDTIGYGRCAAPPRALGNSPAVRGQGGGSCFGCGGERGGSVVLGVLSWHGMETCTFLLYGTKLNLQKSLWRNSIASASMLLNRLFVVA